eukprot:767924-Hanusia_phi.AAC.6
MLLPPTRRLHLVAQHALAVVAEPPVAVLLAQHGLVLGQGLGVVRHDVLHGIDGFVHGRLEVQREDLERPEQGRRVEPQLPQRAHDGDVHPHLRARLPQRLERDLLVLHALEPALPRVADLRVQRSCLQLRHALAARPRHDAHGAWPHVAALALLQPALRARVGDVLGSLATRRPGHTRRLHRHVEVQDGVALEHAGGGGGGEGSGWEVKGLLECLSGDGVESRKLFSHHQAPVIIGIQVL